MRTNLPLLFLLVTLESLGVFAKTLEFFIAVVETKWEYVLSDTERKPDSGVQKCVKAVYTEFTDSTFTRHKAKPAWSGILGPIIRSAVNDRVVIHFKNFASQSFSMSPIGVSYWKRSEGAGYEDSSSVNEKADDAVAPGGYYKYVWEISPSAGPTPSDPDCLTYIYSSQVDAVRDFNSGLIGPLLICKAGVLSEERHQMVQEFVLLFAVFDESKSWYREAGRQDKLKKSPNPPQYHTINGHSNYTLPGLTVCLTSTTVSWHLIGHGSSPLIHSIQFEEHTLRVFEHKHVAVEMTPMTFTTALMKPSVKGRFLISCKIHSHQGAGMDAIFSVENCPSDLPGGILPSPDKRNAIHTDEDDEEEDDNFSSILFKSGGPMPVLRSSARGKPKVRVHYISAEEIDWDYSALSTDPVMAVSSDRLRDSSRHVYKKVAYVEYTDESFSVRKSSERRIMGPELRGEVGDSLQIVFKNKANRPFNIYPLGLSSVQPVKRKRTDQRVDLRSLAVPTGEIMMYQWRLTAEDAPTDAEPRCLTRLYHSTLDPLRDVASGLVGPLIICRSQSLDKRGRVVTSDKEKQLMFTVFDENRSWYSEENFERNHTDPKLIQRRDPSFYSSNLMHTVNGFMWGGLRFRVCVGDVILWHVSSVGLQSHFLSVYFSGNTFERERSYGTVLTLFPMSGDTVITEVEVLGEWEVSAFDPSLKNRGMSLRYMVVNCERNLPLVDNEDYDEEFVDILEQNFPIPRGAKEKNHTVTEIVCKNATLSDSEINQENTSRTPNNEMLNRSPNCKIRYVSGRTENNVPSKDSIPQDILDQMDMDMSGNSVERFKRSSVNIGSRRRRSEISNEVLPDTFPTVAEELPGELHNLSSKPGAEQENVSHSSIGPATDFLRSFNMIRNQSQGSEPLDNVEEMNDQVHMKNQQLMKLAKVLKDPEMSDVKKDKKEESLDYVNLHVTTTANPSLLRDYDDYSDEENTVKSNHHRSPDANMWARSTDSIFRSYYIAAEEIMWDYGIKKPSQLIKPRDMRRGMRKFFPAYRKAVFRAYQDREFTQPISRGELEQHLGILGPVIRVVFRNRASRPFSFHLHGIYDKMQGAFGPEGLKAEDVPGDPVPPGQERVYNWRISRRQGPSGSEFDCKAGAYYSTVDMEKDINSGLIGPLLICRPGTLRPPVALQPGVSDFFLLFTTFQERKSWYLDYNIKKFCLPPCRAQEDEPWFTTSNTFSAINGFVAETLPGLLVEQYSVARWHLLNVGSEGEFHAVHFHGLPFSVGKEQQHRRGVYNLYPGAFGTVQMRPTHTGTWLIECTIGEHHLAGMRAKLLVYSPTCVQPLGMQSGWIQDNQISASDYNGDWKPTLARLERSGSINAWMGSGSKSWLQVDLLRPMLLHGLQVQGAKASLGLSDFFTLLYSISYSSDQVSWSFYRGNSSGPVYTFSGNMDGSRVVENVFSPPVIARYIRIHPLTFHRQPTLRVELLGCDLNSCWMPLGIQRGIIPNSNITASSFLKKWLLSWSPFLARLQQQGRANAWRPKSDSGQEWLQVDMGRLRRLTGVVVQGARSVLTPLLVTEFSVSVSSDDGSHWISVKDSSGDEQLFEGNTDPDEEVLVLFDSPLFTRFIRIYPKGWVNHIALRLELLGCDTQPDSP